MSFSSVWTQPARMASSRVGRLPDQQRCRDRVARKVRVQGQREFDGWNEESDPTALPGKSHDQQEYQGRLTRSRQTDHMADPVQRDRGIRCQPTAPGRQDGEHRSAFDRSQPGEKVARDARLVARVFIVERLCDRLKLGDGDADGVSLLLVGSHCRPRPQGLDLARIAYRVRSVVAVGPKPERAHVIRGRDLEGFMRQAAEQFPKHVLAPRIAGAHSFADGEAGGRIGRDLEGWLLIVGVGGMILLPDAGFHHGLLEVRIRLDVHADQSEVPQRYARVHEGRMPGDRPIAG